MSLTTQSIIGPQLKSVVFTSIHSEELQERFHYKSRLAQTGEWIRLRTARARRQSFCKGNGGGSVNGNGDTRVSIRITKAETGMR